MGEKAKRSSETLASQRPASEVLGIFATLRNTLTTVRAAFQKREAVASTTLDEAERLLAECDKLTSEERAQAVRYALKVLLGDLVILDGVFRHGRHTRKLRQILAKLRQTE